MRIDLRVVAFLPFGTSNGWKANRCGSRYTSWPLWRSCFRSIPAAPLRAFAADARPPNVVFILADDFGWSDLGCYGSTFHRTPNLDRLASQGVRFTNAYAACPVCSPTRASILTGKYPPRLHLTDWLPGRPNRPDQKLRRPAIEPHLPLEEVTIAEALKPAGYVSASIGKWHLGGQGFLPEDQGFDVNVAGGERGSPSTYFSPYHIAKLPDGPKGEYLTDRLTDEAIRFVEQNKDRPFFLYLPHYTVHIPLGARRNWSSSTAAASNPAPRRTTRPTPPWWTASTPAWANCWTSSTS